VNITVPEPTVPQVVRAALPIVKRLKQRDADYWEDRRVNGRSNYCHHGHFVGDPYGPDYMCGMCEDGITTYEEAIEEARVVVQRRLAAVACLFKLDQLRVFDQHEVDELRDAVSIRITQRLYDGVQ